MKTSPYGFPVAFFLLMPLGILYWDFNIKVLTYALIWLPLEVLGGVLFIKGLKHAPLSVAMSFYSFMPVFSALFGWLILPKEPSPMGMLGMSLPLEIFCITLHFCLPYLPMWHLRKGYLYWSLSFMEGCF